jgi:hypothetical protein
MQREAEFSETTRLRPMKNPNKEDPMAQKTESPKSLRIVRLRGGFGGIRICFLTRLAYGHIDCALAQFDEGGTEATRGDDG